MHDCEGRWKRAHSDSRERARPPFASGGGPRFVGLLLVIGVLQFGSIGPPTPPFEVRCSCIGVPALAEALVSADAVFVGTVTSASRLIDLPLAPGSDGGEIVLTQRSIELRVLSAWKGIDRDIVRVQTGLADGDCGFPFAHGSTYLVFARADGSALTTSICTRTAEVGDALADLVELGQPGYTPSRR